MLSIITPVYNGDRFIAGCIQAVIDQACPDVEHIIVDGGSTDRTVEIIQHYAQQFPHIRWISEPDQGQSDAMNRGIAMAQGNIINILNVDDFYQPNVLNRVLKIFEQLPDPSFLVGNCQVWSNENRLLYINKPSNISLFNILLDINQFPFNPSAYFYHASLHQLVGTYDVNEHYVMDLDFVLRAIQVASVQYVDEIWGNFRLVQGTKTSEAKQSGTNDNRVTQVLTKYRQQLSPLDRLRLSTKAIENQLKAGGASLKRSVVRIVQPSTPIESNK